MGKIYLGTFDRIICNFFGVLTEQSPEQDAAQNTDLFYIIH